MSKKLLKTIRLIVIAEMHEDFDYISNQVQEISRIGFPELPSLQAKLRYVRTILAGTLNGTKIASTSKICYLFECEEINDELKDDIEFVYEYKRAITSSFTKIN